MFRKKTRAIDAEPATLSLEALTALKVSLLAKVILVNNELRKRYAALLATCESVPEYARQREILARAVEGLDALNCVIEYELGRMKGLQR